MHLLTTRWKLVTILGLILVTGFIGVNLANYYVSSNSVRDALINNELPLTSNNIYSEIQAGLLRPIYISSLMANDTFLKDWVLDGEKGVGKISKYLAEIKNRYNVSSTFVVSNITRRYYHYDGVLKTVSPKVPKDNWFFSMESHPKNYRVDVDYNEAKHNSLTIFVNHKLYDYEGKFLGVTGLGLDVMSVAKMIEHYMQDYSRNIFFVDKSGEIKSHHDETLIDKVSIRALPGIKSVADELLRQERGFLRYETDDDTVLLSFRYIPELDWYLVVEQPESEALRPIRNALYFNLTVSAAVTLLVLLFSAITVNRFHTRLEEMARTDKLTGLVNRHYFDLFFEHEIEMAERQEVPLTLAVFDIDNLKSINDRYGHLEGDRVITAVAAHASDGMRKVDVLSRWGGDEFAVLLFDCDEATAAELMDRLRLNIKEKVRLVANGEEVSISVGVAGYESGDTPEALLARTDSRLYRAKAEGRNRVVYADCEVAGVGTAESA